VTQRQVAAAAEEVNRRGHRIPGSATNQSPGSVQTKFAASSTPLAGVARELRVGTERALAAQKSSPRVEWVSVSQVRFFKSRARKRIAYADEGEGPLILLPAWWVSHLEKDAEDPAYQHFFGRLASMFRVVRYDRVGVGMSDRARRRFTLASELSDFTDLVEHLSAPRFHLLGFSCACPVALAYAAKHPDRVDRIILYGSYLRGASISPSNVKAALIALVRAHGRLGSRTLADILYPTGDADARSRFNALQHESAKPDTAARLLELTYALDARPFAPRVRAPVLVLHRKGDHAIPYEEGARVAASLENATLCTLPGRSHLPWHENGDSVVDAIAAFLNVGFTRPADAAADSSAELRREGEVWRLRFDGRQSLLRSSKGLLDLARLLGHPGEDIHVLDLVGEPGSERRDAHRVDLALDIHALQSYRRRLAELDEALAEAQANVDLGRQSKLAAEREALLRQLAADTGRRGRSRRLNDPIERARKAVAARLRDAIGHVKIADRAAGVHLEQSIRTGVHCAYRPTQPVRWSVSPDSL